MTVFTTPKTWAFQEGLESSELNIHLRDNEVFLYGGRARTTGDQSNSTTTFADATNMTFPIAASEIFQVQLDCVMQVGGAEDGKTTWTVPAGATGRHWYRGGAAGDSSAAIGADVVIGVGGTSDYIIQFGAIIINSTNAGTCQFRFAQFAGGANAVILRAHAVLIAERVS